jgi:FKBP-type peptidyl-prolyl cis-trans isomerase FklB
MRKIISILILFLTLNSFAQKPVTKTTIPVQTGIKLKNASDSLQYIMGAYIAQWITGNAFSITNPSLFNNGMDNILQNKTRLIPDSMIAPLLTMYQEGNQKNRAFNEEQLLFATLKDKPGVGMFPNGVRYIVLQTGKGRRPQDTDSIVLNMIAKLPDGTVVEDTYQTQKPFHAKTSSFFPGLNDALPLMTEGSRWQLYIPAAMAYGDKGTTLIPPHSALVIEAELVKVKPGQK